MLFIRACFDLQVQGFSNTKLLILGKFINCECWGSMFSLCVPLKWQITDFIDLSLSLSPPPPSLSPF